MPDRRQFMISVATAAAAGSLPLSHSALAGLPATDTQSALAVYRPGTQASRDFAMMLQKNGVTAIALAEDPVRQWRDMLLPRLEARSGPLYGMTDWSDYQLMRGLGAELRRHVRHESVHDDRQQTLYTWVVA